MLIAASLPSLAQDGASYIEFAENKGQWDSRVHFKGEMNAGSFFLLTNGFRVLWYNPDELARVTDGHLGTAGAATGGGPVKKALAVSSAGKPQAGGEAPVNGGGTG